MILVGVDGSRAGLEAAGWAAREAALRRVPLRVVHAIPAWVLWIIVAIWTVPTLGVLVSSFRTAEDQRASGWWEAIGDLDNLTLDNYRTVLESSGTAKLGDSLLNSFAIAIPAV